MKIVNKIKLKDGEESKREMTGRFFSRAVFEIWTSGLDMREWMGKKAMETVNAVMSRYLH